MTFTLNMTMLAVLALLVSIAAFFAPRFLGIMVAIGLFGFAIYQLFPEVRDWRIANAIEEIDFPNVSWRDTPPTTTEPATSTN